MLSKTSCLVMPTSAFPNKMFSRTLVVILSRPIVPLSSTKNFSNDALAFSVLCAMSHCLSTYSSPLTVNLMALV
jgi:hypothetical protein